MSEEFLHAIINQGFPNKGLPGLGLGCNEAVTPRGSGKTRATDTQVMFAYQGERR